MGSVGRALGTVVGGVGGFLIGGPAGAAIGAGLGSGIGGAIDVEHQARRAQSAAAEENQRYLQELQRQEQFINRVRDLQEKRRKEILEAPSIAEEATRLGIEQATRQALASATAQRGLSPGLAAALAARQMGQASVEAIARGAIMQAEENLARRQLALETEKTYEDMIKQLLAARMGAALSKSEMAQREVMEAERRRAEALGGIGSALIGVGISGMGGSKK